MLHVAQNSHKQHNAARITIKGAGGSVHGVIRGTLQASVWKKYGKPRKISGRIF
jgi:hypothetical protein